MSQTFLSDKLPGLTSPFHIFMLYDMLVFLKLHIFDNYDRSCFHLRYAQKSYFLINIPSSCHELLLQLILHSTNLSEQRHWKKKLKPSIYGFVQFPFLCEQLLLNIYPVVLNCNKKYQIKIIISRYAYTHKTFFRHHLLANSGRAVLGYLWETFLSLSRTSFVQLSDNYPIF